MTIQVRVPKRDGNGRLLNSFGEISMSYLKGWFVIDFLSIFPFEIVGSAIGGGEDDESKLALLRIMRLARLLKLLRILRASRKLQRWRIQSGLRYSTIQLTTVFQF